MCAAQGGRACAAAFAQDPSGKKRRLIPVRVAECIFTGMLSAIIYIDLVGLSERALVDGLKPSGRPAQPQFRSDVRVRIPSYRLGGSFAGGGKR